MLFMSKRGALPMGTLPFLCLTGPGDDECGDDCRRAAQDECSGSCNTADDENVYVYRRPCVLKGCGHDGGDIVGELWVSGEADAVGVDL